MGDWKIVHLPGSRVSPQVVLHQTLEKVSRVKAVTLVIQWDDDTYDIDWSRQTASELCMGAVLLQAEAAKIAQGGDE